MKSLVKHCGSQGTFTISLEKLHMYTGSVALLKMFQLVKTNDLPDYALRYDAERDVVIFNNRNLTSEQAEKEHLNKIYQFPQGEAKT